MPGSPDDGVAVCAVCTVSLVAVSRTSGMARALSHGGDCGGLRCVHTMSRIASAANECPRWIRFGQGSRSGRWREVWPYELSGTTFFRAVESAEFETSVGGHACDPPLPCDQAPRGTRSVLWPESLCAWSSQRDPPRKGHPRWRQPVEMDCTRHTAISCAWPSIARDLRLHIHSVTPLTAPSN